MVKAIYPVLCVNNQLYLNKYKMKKLDQSVLDEAKNLISDAQNIAIVPSRIAGIDSFGAAVGLYFVLSEQGKDVYFVYPDDVPEEAQGLIESDRIVKNIKDRELLVTIDYSGTTAAAAHYSTEGEKLEVKLGPVPKDFSKTDRVKTELVGFDFDVIIVLGAQELNDLGSTFKSLRESFSDAKVINVDNTERNKNYGRLNLIDLEATSLSQLVFKMASAWGFIPSEKASLALLRGMTYRSLRF